MKPLAAHPDARHARMFSLLLHAERGTRVAQRREQELDEVTAQLLKARAIASLQGPLPPVASSRRQSQGSLILRFAMGVQSRLFPILRPDPSQSGP